MLPRDLIGAASCPRLVCVDYITGNGLALFEAVRQIGEINAAGFGLLFAAALRQ